jgi:hypothetical protein
MRIAYVFYRLHWPLLTATFAALAVMVAISGDAVRAAPPKDADPAFAAWFQSLRQPGSGISCCSIADCRITTYRTNANGYETLIDGTWRPVPPDKVLQHIGNPTGRAVVCYSPALGVLCFVRPAET